jgi:hypothetical protein
MLKPLTSPANLQARLLASNPVTKIDPGRAGKQVGPGLGHGITYRADAAQTCHDDTTTAHSEILKRT